MYIKPNNPDLVDDTHIWRFPEMGVTSWNFIQNPHPKWIV